MARGTSILEVGAGLTRRVDEHLVEIVASQGEPSKPARIPPFDGDALSGDEHAIHLQCRAPNLPVQAETYQDIERSRVQRIATELRSRKGRPIDQADSRPGSCEHGRGNRAGWSCSDDENVEHRHARVSRPGYPCPMTRALFFEPKPRQLQSAAPMLAGRPVFGT